MRHPLRTLAAPIHNCAGRTPPRRPAGAAPHHLYRQRTNHPIPTTTAAATTAAARGRVAELVSSIRDDPADSDDSDDSTPGDDRAAAGVAALRSVPSDP